MEDARRAYHQLKLRFRRKVRKQKRQVEGMTEQADDSLNKHFFKRFGRLYGVRRFVFTWTALLLFIGLGAVWQVRSLDSFYLELAPVNGGVYREGIIGNYTTANPLFAVGSANVAVSKLVFSGLFKLSPNGVLEPDLATGFKINDTNDKYTVSLRDDVVWHDGEQFNSEDVVFTYNRIKNPDVKSPLESSWRNVTIKAIDDYTVEFKLSNTLGPFMYSLVNGIVPKHILEDVPLADLRTSTFNTVNPVGTGPFTYTSVEVLGDNIDERHEKVSLKANENYYSSKPKIERILLRTYREEDTMLQDFEDKEISSMVGLQTVSDRLLQDETIKTFSTPLSSQVLVFFNNASPVLSDVKVRQALLKATDIKALRQSVGYQLIESDSPFLKSHFAYDPEKTQIAQNISDAEKLFEEAGWLKDDSGQLVKDGKPLTLLLISQSLTEYATIVRGLQEQWGAMGVKVDAILQPEEDIQSGAIVRHDYDVLLYGISLGPDPDVFAYWHSSQADARVKAGLNLSEYKNNTADAALEAGRTRLDENLRKIKYGPFLDAWIEDAPAIALYQPRFLFVFRGSLTGYKSGEFNSPSDRFYSITDWQIRREKAIK